MESTRLSWYGSLSRLMSNVAFKILVKTPTSILAAVVQHNFNKILQVPNLMPRCLMDYQTLAFTLNFTQLSP